MQKSELPKIIDALPFAKATEDLPYLKALEPKELLPPVFWGEYDVVLTIPGWYGLD